MGVLPLPHSILVRRYQPCVYTDTWFTTFLWSIIFMRHQLSPIFDPSGIRLFTVELRHTKMFPDDEEM